jgi:hypothetical protein
MLATQRSFHGVRALKNVAGDGRAGRCSHAAAKTALKRAPGCTW